MALPAAVWRHDGPRWDAVLSEATERGGAGAGVDPGGYATFIDHQDAADILIGLNDPGGTTPLRTDRSSRRGDHPSTVGDLPAIIDVIRSCRFTFSREAELQEGVATALARLGCPVGREVWLSGADRIDFLIEGVGVEVKIGGSVSTVLRQLQRYGAHHQVSGLVLVTACARRHQGLPARVGGKALEVVYIGGMW